MMLEVRELACVRAERLVFDSLDFRVDSGEALILRGPNGSGKTSLLRIVAGLLRPAEGAILWNGSEVDEDPIAYRARLRYIGHLDAVKPAFTVAENIGFWASFYGGSGTESQALERFGIARLADVPARFLSAGQRRRLALARLCAGASDLWVLDEPTVSLDDDGVATLAALTGEHRERGGIVLAATHVDLGFGNARSVVMGDEPVVASTPT